MTTALDPRAFAEAAAKTRTVHELRKRPAEDALEYFERVAAMFYADTGYLRPGKDCVVHSREEREATWDAWLANVRGIK